MDRIHWRRRESGLLTPDMPTPSRHRGIGIGIGLGLRPYSTPQYFQRVLGTPGLLAYWPLWESSGSVAADLSGNGRNGAYTGVTFNQPGVNLLSNPGFETAGGGGADVFANWDEGAVDGGTIVRTTTAGEFRSGVAAAKLTGGASGNTYITQLATSTIPGTPHAVRFWTRGDGTNAGRLNVVASGGDPEYYALQSTGITGTPFQQIILPFTAQTLLTYLYLMAPTANGGIAYFDDTELYSTGANGIGDGQSGVYSDGTNDKITLPQASLGAFNGAEGGAGVWFRVGGSGVWTDGTKRYLLYYAADASNYVAIYKSTVNNTLVFEYSAGGTLVSVTLGSQTSTAWQWAALSWGKSADQMIAVLGTAQAGATQTGLGIWAGALATALVGAGSATPTNVWSGLLAHSPLWNVAPGLSQLVSLGRA